MKRRRRPVALPEDADSVRVANYMLLAADDFQARGRRALSFAVMNPGITLIDAAKALRTAADRIAVRPLIGTTMIDAEDVAALSNARRALDPVLRWFDGEEPRVTSLQRALDQMLRAALPPSGHKGFRSKGEGARHPTAQLRRSSSRGAYPRNRRFLVKEIIENMCWSGAIFACACKTRESALRCFERRLARNERLGVGTGLLSVIDRRTGTVLASTQSESDPT